MWSFSVATVVMLYGQGKPPGAELAHLCIGTDGKTLKKILIIAGDLHLSRLQLTGGLLYGEGLIGISLFLGEMAFSVPS